jgi:hypothetical protein
MGFCKKPVKPTEVEKAFAQGAALVCGIVAKEFSVEDAKYLLGCVGLNKKECTRNDVDEHDMECLKPVFKLQDTEYRGQKRRAGLKSVPAYRWPDGVFRTTPPCVRGGT